MFTKKAKIRKLFFILLLLTKGLYAELLIPQSGLSEKIDLEPEEDELLVIDRMIALTEKQQKAQKKLKNLLVSMKKNKELFLAGEPSKMHALYMIKCAEKSLKLIRKYHLQHLFPSDFMEELALFNTIGKSSLYE